MAWAKLPDLDGLEDAYTSKARVTDIRPKKRYRPEVERLRPQAERDFSDPDELEAFLQQKEDEAASRERPGRALLWDVSSRQEQTIGPENAPETQQYLQGGRTALGRLRQQRAEEGRTSATTGELLGALGGAALYTTDVLPGSAIDVGLRTAGVETAPRRRNPETGKVEPLGAENLAFLAGGAAVGRAAGPLIRRGIRGGKKAVGKVAKQREFVRQSVRNFLKDETGAYRLPGTEVDELPDDVARVAFGEAEEAPYRFDPAARARGGLTPDVSFEDYRFNQAGRPGTLEHVDKESLKGLYDDARERASLAQDKLDDLGESGSGVRELGSALESVSKYGEELYRRTQGQQGMAPRLRSFISKFIQDESGMVRLPGGKEPPSDLTRQLEESVKIGKTQGKEALAAAGQKQAQAVVEEMRAKDALGKSFYKERGRLGKRARGLSERMDIIKKQLESRLGPGERGATSAKGQFGPLTDQLDALRKKIAKSTSAGEALDMADVEEMNRLLKLTRQTPEWQALARQQELQAGIAKTGGGNIPSQQPTLAMGEQGATLPLREGQVGYQGPVPPSGTTLEQQRLQRGLQESATQATPSLEGIGGGPPVGGAPPGGGKGPPGQPDFFGGYDPVKQPGSVVAEVLRSIVSIPGEAIANVSALSPPLLRQGRVRLVTSPINAIKEFGSSVRNAFSEARALKMQEGITTAPWVRETEGTAFNSGYTWGDNGGHILPLGGAPEERELVGDSWLGRKLRGFGPRKISDRQAVLELNAHRTNWYSEVAQNMWKSGETDTDQYRKLVQRIEHWTQRGNIGQPKNFPLFFSMQAQSGRVKGFIDIIHDVPTGLATGRVFQPGVEQEATKALVAMVVSNMALMGGAATIGLGALEDKGGLPTWRDGAFHWDPWAGWNAPAKYVVGIGKDIARELGDGDLATADLNAIAERTVDRTLRYVQNQLSPAYGAIVSAATGRDFAGRSYSLARDIRSGKLVADLTTPLVIRDIVDAFLEGGAGAAAAVAGPSFLSEAVSVYDSLGGLRDDAAKRGVEVEGKTIKAKSYEDATPAVREAIDKTEAVAKFQEEHPSVYRETVNRREAQSPGIQEAKRAESNFDQGLPLDKPIREFWQKESDARREIATTMQDQFAKMFSGFDKLKFDKAVEGYYKIEEKDEFGNRDWDATEKARQDYFASLSADQQQWVDEALQVTRERKSPQHREYLDYLDVKESRGYFRPGIKESERAKLDKQNPDLDVQAWKFGGLVLDDTGTVKAGPALQSVEAVSQALSLNLPGQRPIKFANTDREINRNEGSLVAWQAQGPRIEYYQNSGGPAVLDSAAKQLFKGVPYERLEPSDQEKVRNRIKSELRQDPRLQATLIWWGVIDKPTSNAAIRELADIIKQYGPLLPEKK